MVHKRATDSFERGVDGRWRCIEAVTLHYADHDVPIEAGAEFGPGDTRGGMKVAEYLDSLVETRRAGT